MSGPSGSNIAEKAVAASAATLTLPQRENTEKGIRTGAIDDPAQHTETRSSAEKEKAREDEEWLENPAHPRNWSSTKKWTNMAIVSRLLPRSRFPPASHFRNFRFPPTRFYLRSQVR